ncbi:hypothetical protein [uncultured Amnibacterium sp.]|uniref:hypothetical protein n=1 Tax=uncultured Amnibacterium sp. TaxID=1631851 RepID=UPI0035C96D10
MGTAWGFVLAGMLAVLLAVFVLRLRRSQEGFGRLVAIGVLIGLGVAAVALVAALND